ncbi:uncharacterized protein LY89DRAFT_422378 [Mollisia scopiformis]|uniref:Uncharacterized protein n=1 Tax=Mollisia scopiformis TaxID=149040 RepID=A0A194XLJ1_MOLSC|nr:uncharacterized protein LY89DRAFT_422378 [Mollisia scopiformis]KUJ21001.1 hypothetical protein LY89DRAFT_422378 [Mollisia scopiformis]
MFSTFPSTPRGRSRFSKALPVAPGQSAEKEESSAMMSSSGYSPLPPLPNDASVPAKTIPRRPVGGQAKPPKPPSIRSLSSVYSDSPGLSRSLSDSSSRDTKDSVSAIDSEIDQNPPPPPKDKVERQTTNILDSPLSSNGSPKQTELWKRRSVRSEKSIVVPDLKLSKSNGSTASPPRRQEQSTDRPLPRSITGRKPVPVRPAPPQPEFMGNKLAKLEGKLENKLKKQTSSEESSKQDEAPPQQYPSFQRLPTPEYLKADKQQPTTPQVLSPVSPFTPPEETAPKLPPKAEARNYLKTQPTMSDTEVPNLLANHSRDTSDTLTITSEPQVMRSPQPQKAFTARILTPQPSPDKEKTTSPLNLGSPAAHSSFFPTVNSPAAQGTIFSGPSLDIIHYDCYQSHKFMRGSRNALCPVACMICQKKDAEMRWRCTWCCLSACGSCMQVLSSVPGKDLRVCLERIENGK